MVVAPSAQVMVHDAACMAWGNEAEHLAAAAVWAAVGTIAAK